MTAAKQLAQFQMIRLSVIEQSPLNPRKNFDEAKLDELVESVRAKGVLEPLLVRALEDGTFEVAAGARRLRAAELAELQEVPCLVREMSDAELLEVAILENVVRHDISALEEGDAYRALVKDHGYTVEQLVEKTGRSRTVVFARMKLAELTGDCRNMLAQGKLSASVAELIARLPTTKAQEGALATLVEKAHWRNVDQPDGTGFKDLSRVPFREAKDILDEEFRLVLKEASFDTKDAELLEGVGACTACPKRTGADKETFGDVKADTCLDAVCWKAKTAAGTRALKAEMKERGKELVKVARVTDTYSSSGLVKSVAEKYSRPTDKVDGKNTWQNLLGGLDGAAVVALDKENKTHNLVDKKKALELLKAKDPKKAAALEKALEAPPADDWKARQKKEQEERARQQLATRLVQAKALEGITDEKKAMALWFASLASDAWNWAGALRRAGLPKGTKLEKLKPADKVRLVLVEAFAGAHRDRSPVPELAAKELKLDLKKLRKQAKEAETGKCFVCGSAKVASWADEDTKLLCAPCQGEEE